MPPPDITKFCYWSINKRKGVAEVYGPSLAMATKCAEALGGQNIHPISSCENTVSFTMSPPHEE